MGRVRYKIIWDQMSARWAELGIRLYGIKSVPDGPS